MSRFPTLKPDSLPPSRPAGPDSRWTIPIICLALAAVTLAVFGQTLRHEFVNYDDDAYVYENPTVTGGLTFRGIEAAFTKGSAENWDPLTTISHMLDCQLYGLNAGGHHMTNVLLHAATVILLFLVLRRMTGAVWRSAFVAAVFAIHPLRVESVAWVAERKDVLSGLFFMLTLWAYVRYVRQPLSLRRYLMMMLCFVLGLMSKAMLVTLPFVLLLLDYWPLKRFTAPGFAGGGAGPVEGLKIFSFSAADGRKDSAADAFPCVLCGGDHRPGPCGSTSGEIPAFFAHWQRAGFLCCLRVADVLPDAAGGLLSLSGQRPAAWRSYFGVIDIVGRLGGGFSLAAVLSLSFGRLAVVSGDVDASDRSNSEKAIR